MTGTQEVAVTLTPALYAHLKAEAAQLGLPLEWLVAALVADTIEEPTLVTAA